MDKEQVTLFWENKAGEFDPETNPDVVSLELLSIAATLPSEIRSAISAAARAVGRRYCKHGDTEPPPLPDIMNLSERKAAAEQHPGLCGYHHAGAIGNVDVRAVIDRSGAEVTTKRMRNQACFETSTSLLNAKGRGVQLRRAECFTQACRAVWPGDQRLPETMQQALLDEL